MRATPTRCQRRVPLVEHGLDQVESKWLRTCTAEWLGERRKHQATRSYPVSEACFLKDECVPSGVNGHAYCTVGAFGETLRRACAVGRLPKRFVTPERSERKRSGAGCRRPHGILVRAAVKVSRVSVCRARSQIQMSCSWSRMSSATRVPSGAMRGICRPAAGRERFLAPHAVHPDE